LTLGYLVKETWREQGQKGRVFRVNVKVDPSFIPEAFKAQPQATIESKVLAHSEEERQKEKKGTANADESLKKTAEGKPKKATKKK
jgi:hypothetical protein